MKQDELKSMDVTQLNSRLKELKKELIKQNALVATGTPPKSPGLIREIKKTVSRILTIIGQKESEQEVNSKQR